jgi:hypothetical protein
MMKYLPFLSPCSFRHLSLFRRLSLFPLPLIIINLLSLLLISILKMHLLMLHMLSIDLLYLIPYISCTCIQILPDNAALHLHQPGRLDSS